MSDITFAELKILIDDNCDRIIAGAAHAKEKRTAAKKAKPPRKLSLKKYIESQTCGDSRAAEIGELKARIAAMEEERKA